MGLEIRTFICDPAKPGQRKNLKPAAVGQNGTMPVHKPVQAGELADDITSGPEIQMVGVAQNNLCATGCQILGRQGFDCGQCANRHKDRCFNRAMCRDQCACSGAGLGGSGKLLKNCS